MELEKLFEEVEPGIFAFWNGEIFSNAKNDFCNQSTSNGYKVITINGKTKSVHRLIAKAFSPNQYSKPEVDHIDCDRSNNYFTNLQWVTTSENIQASWDRTRQRGSVTYQKTNKRWTARITINNERKYLGCFKTKEEAEKVLQWHSTK